MNSIKLEKFVGAKNSKGVQIAEEAINNIGIKVRPVYSSGGSWKHSKLNDHMNAVIANLEINNVTYEKGNDAPRGGKTGAYIIVKSL